MIQVEVKRFQKDNNFHAGRINLNICVNVFERHSFYEGTGLSPRLDPR